MDEAESDIATARYTEYTAATLPQLAANPFLCNHFCVFHYAQPDSNPLFTAYATRPAGCGRSYLRRFLAIATAKPLALTPTFRNAFSMPAGDEVTGQPVAIYFRRDAAGKVTSFSAGDDRVWDLRFDRLR